MVALSMISPSAETAMLLAGAPEEEHKSLLPALYEVYALACSATCPTMRSDVRRACRAVWRRRMHVSSLCDVKSPS